MNINRKVLIITLIVAIINAILFIVPIQRTIVLFTADFLIIILAIFTISIILTKSQKNKDGNVARSRFFGWPVIRVSILGFLSSVIVNLLLIIVDQIKMIDLWIVIVINLIWFVVICILLIVSDSGKALVDSHRIQRNERTSKMKELRLQSRQLIMLCSDSKLQKRIQDLSDAFRYSDPNSSSEVEEIEKRIEDELALLSTFIERDIEQSYKQVEKVEKLLKIRNNMELAAK